MQYSPASNQVQNVSCVYILIFAQYLVLVRFYQYPLNEKLKFILAGLKIKHLYRKGICQSAKLLISFHFKAMFTGIIDPLSEH